MIPLLKRTFWLPLLAALLGLGVTANTSAPVNYRLDEGS